MFDVTRDPLDYVCLVVTHECNRNCQFCIDEYRGRNEVMTMDIVDKGLKFAKELGAVDILLLGGEATLHPDIVKIAKKVKKAGFNCILTTNYTKPNVVKALDGIVDSFNISYYNQKELPHKDEFKSDLTLSTIIWDGRFENREDLDRFIDKYSQQFDSLKFSTLSIANEWCEEKQKVSWLDELPNKKDILLFREQLGHIYRGYPIERNDVLLVEGQQDSYKVFPDGEISDSWTRDIEAYAMYQLIKSAVVRTPEDKKFIDTVINQYVENVHSPILREELRKELLAEHKPNAFTVKEKFISSLKVDGQPIPSRLIETNISERARISLDCAEL